MNVGPAALARSLEDRGFTWGAGCFQRGETLTVTLEPGWLTFEAPVARRQPEAAEPDAGTGPWKVVGRRQRAELPWSVFADIEPEALPDAVAGITDWLDATATGRLPAGWAPPAPETVAQWLPTERRVLRCGRQLKSLEVSCEASRLAVRCELAASLSWPRGDNRREWLHHTLFDWQTASRMARISGAAGGALVAETDVSGAPPELLEPLFQSGVACLCATLPLLIPTVADLNRQDLEFEYVEIPFCRRRVTAEASETTAKKKENGHADRNSEGTDDRCEGRNNAGGARKRPLV